MPVVNPTFGHIIVIGVMVVALVTALLGMMPWLIAACLIALGVARFT